LEKVAGGNGHVWFNLYSFENSVDFYKGRGYIPAGEMIFEREGVKIPTLRMEKYPGHII
jgi:hypothetical protein